MMTTYFLVNLRGKLNTRHVRNLMDVQRRNLSIEEITRKRNRIFDFEQKKQQDNVGRIEKIEVKFMGTPSDVTMMLNKNISTPFNCAQHISETKCINSVVALVNNKHLWDMHRPLQDSCSLQFLNFRIKDPSAVNKIFWRSCSFLLGAVMQKTFKENAGLFLHSFPYPNIRSGSFIHDIALNKSNWNPSEADLHALGVEFTKLVSEGKKFERLEVSHDVALEMFKDNPFKREQLPSISNKNNGVVTLYRVDQHIDISKGPMIASTSFFEKCKIASAHKISSDENSANIYRVQGVALPTGITISPFAFGILVDRAKKLNVSQLHIEEDDDHHNADHTPLLQQNAN